MSAFGGKADIRLLPITVFIGSNSRTGRSHSHECLLLEAKRTSRSYCERFASDQRGHISRI